MNRIDFFKSINYPDFPKNATEHFDANVVLYHLLRDVHQDINITASELNPDEIHYTITPKNEQAKNLTVILVHTNTSESIYGSRFNIEVCKETSKQIDIAIKSPVLV